MEEETLVMYNGGDLRRFQKKRNFILPPLQFQR